MADKTWTATDLRLGKLAINPTGNGSLHIERRYVFLDAGGDVMPEITGGRLVLDVELSDIPAAILSALQTIDTWTKNQALAKEEMD